MRTRPILLSLALLCACSQTMAAESRHMDPDGDGSCPDSSVATGNERNVSDDETDNDTVAAPVRRTQKAKPAATPRSSNGGGNRNTAPRWHSFLPGMFR